MQLKISYASAAFLSLHFVYADVYILTPGLPAPTATPSFKDEAESSSWDAAISSAVDDRLYSYVLEQPASWLDGLTSVAGDVESFMATATISIPEDVTATDVTTTITTVPEWYTELPENFRKAEESLGTILASISSEEVAKACETGSVKCYTGKNDSGGPKLRAAVGMGAVVAVAAIVGTMML